MCVSVCEWVCDECVCTSECVYMCMSVWGCLSVYECVFEWMWASVYVHVDVDVYECVSVYVSMQVNVWECVNVCVCLWVCACENMSMWMHVSVCECMCVFMSVWQCVCAHMWMCINVNVYVWEWVCVCGHTNDQLYRTEGCAPRHMSVHVEALSCSQPASLPYSLRHGLSLFPEPPYLAGLASQQALGSLTLFPWLWEAELRFPCVALSNVPSPELCHCPLPCAFWGFLNKEIAKALE